MVDETQQSSTDVQYFTNSTSLEPITLRKTEAYLLGMGHEAWGMELGMRWLMNSPHLPVSPSSRLPVFLIYVENASLFLGW